MCVSIKKKASATHDTTQQILGTELAHLTPTVNILPNPPRKEDVPLLPLEYQMTATGKIFLLFYISSGDINRMFIIATYDGIDILGNSIHGLGMVPSNVTLRYFLEYIQFMPWSVMKFFPVFLHFCFLKCV